jgi:peptide/nickel transport system permease protein/oligopeptide transport system permease protein
MVAFIVRRLLRAVLLLVGASALIVTMLRLVPGDPAIAKLGFVATPEEIERVRRELGVDQPIPVQVLRFYEGAIRGDLGESYRTGAPVIAEIRRTFPATVELTMASVLMTILLGMPLGVLAALRRGRWLDELTSAVTLLGVSLPSFWLGLLAILVFSVRLGWLPVAGRGGLRHLILPAVTLAASSLAHVSRLTRAQMLEVLAEDYLLTAKAKGLKRSTVVVRHALRNALVPVVTYLGMQIGVLLGGAVVTETVFSWPGMGRLIVQAVQQRDYPVVQGCAVFLVLIFIVLNLVVDLLYPVLDPRIGHG